jgi:hypothetical protein
MELVSITQALRELVELYAPPTIPIPKLKKAVPAGSHGYAKDTAVVKTGGARPSNVGSDGGGTKAGVAHKDVGTLSKTYTKPKPKGRDNTKTKTTAPAKTPGKTGEKPSCPGGQEPRMVFGKWRCGASKGAAKAKSRIATKRKAKAKSKKKAPQGMLGKLVHKARAVLKSLFK